MAQAIAKPKAATTPKRNWRIEHKGRNVHLVRWDAGTAPSKFVGWVLLRGDEHIDNPHSDLDMLRRHQQEAIERDALILSVGDYLCAMGGKYDPRSSKRGITRPQHQLSNDYFDSIERQGADELMPVADRLIALARGNHEQSILKRHEIDLTERICARLRQATGHPVQAGGYGGYVSFIISAAQSSRTLNLKYFHGSGGGGMMSFDTLRIRRQASHTPDANVVVCGHVHETWWHKIERERFVTANGLYRITKDTQHHIRTGTYKDEYGDGYDGFHVEKGGPPKSIGAIWMKVTLSKDANGNYSVPKCEFSEAS